MDFAGLKDAVNRWAERSFDDVQLNEFVMLAEANIRRRLSGYQREVTTVLTTDANGQVALPSDFIGFVGVSLNDRPYKYSISGSMLTVHNTTAQTFDVTYYGILPALSETNTTNWLLQAAPDAYLWLVKAQAREFNEEFEAAAGLEAKGLAAIADLSIQNAVAQYGRAGMNLPVKAF